MRPVRSVAVTTLACALVASTLAGCSSAADESAEAGEIVIAADLELSGADAAVGKGYESALQLKVEQLNASGLTGGRPVRLIVKDNRSDPAESLRNIEDFVADRAVSAVIMGACDECAVGAAKTLNEKGLPAISLASATSVATPVTDRRFVFKLGANAADNAASLAAELRRLNLKRVALLYSADAYGQDGKVAITRELTKDGGKVVVAQDVKPTETDIEPAMAKLTEKNAQALVVWTGAEQATLAGTWVADEKWDGAVLFDAAAAGDLFLGSGDTKMPDGASMVFTQTMVIDDVIATTPAKAARKAWFRDYTARFGSYYGFASFAADALQLATDATVRTDGSPGAPDRNGIRDLLETSQLDGLSGPIRITPDNHSGLMPQSLTMLVARSGRWRLAG